MRRALRIREATEVPALSAMALMAAASCSLKRTGKACCRSLFSDPAKRTPLSFIQREFVKDNRAALHDCRRKRPREDFERRSRQQGDLTESREKRRMELYDAKEKIIVQERQAIRDQNRRFRRALYLRQQHERAKLQMEQESRLDRLRKLLEQASDITLREP